MESWHQCYRLFAWMTQLNSDILSNVIKTRSLSANHMGILMTVIVQWLFETSHWIYWLTVENPKPIILKLCRELQTQQGKHFYEHLAKPFIRAYCRVWKRHRGQFALCCFIVMINPLVSEVWLVPRQCHWRLKDTRHQFKCLQGTFNRYSLVLTEKAVCKKENPKHCKVFKLLGQG